MRKLRLGTMLALAIVIGLGVATAAFAYNEAPELAARVAAGELPPVEERLPLEPVIVEPVESIGVYGGTWNLSMADSLNQFYNWGCIGLTRWAQNQADIVPDLAKGWDESEDGRTFTFYLREGLKWSDGAPFTADDLMFWYEDIVLNDDITPVKPQWFTSAGKLGETRKIDDYTVEFHFQTPNGLFITFLTMYLQDQLAPKHYLAQFHPRYVPIADLEQLARERGFDDWYSLFGYEWGAEGWTSLNPNVPTLNPWVPTVFAPAERYVFKRNPYFHKVDTAGNQLPYIDQISFTEVDHEVLNMNIIAGNVDMVGTRPLSFRDLPLYLQYADEGNYRVLQWDNLEVCEAAIWLNNNTPDETLRSLFGDKRFRQALSVAINRENINDTLYLGLGRPVQVTLGPVVKYAKDEYLDAYVEFDPDRSNEILDDLGLAKRDGSGLRLRPDGKPLQLVLNVPETRVAMVDSLQLVKDDWRAVGVDLVIRPISDSLFNTRIASGEVEVVGWPMAKSAADPGLVPTRTNVYFGPLWGLWYLTNGAQGIEPPQEAMDLINWWDEIQLTVDEDRKAELYDNILQSQAENLWGIGVVGMLPKPMIVKNNFHNVPEFSTWSYHHGRFVGQTEIYQYYID